MSLRNQIKRILREAVGVPEGIYDSAETLTKEIIANLGNFGSEGGDRYRELLHFETPLRISDLEIEQIEITIELHQQSFDVDGAVLASLQVPTSDTGKPDIKQKKPKISQYLDKDNLRIFFNFAYSDDNGFEKVEEWFMVEKNKNTVISSLAHELKHLYDAFKQKYISVKSRVDYSAINKSFSGDLPFCEPIKKMFFLSYFIHDIENLVRPTELYSYMMSNKITKEKFAEELKNTEIYEHLKSAMSFNRENLKNDLLNYMDCINTTLEANGFPFMDGEDELKVFHYMNVISPVFAQASAEIFTKYIENFDRTIKDDFDDMMRMLGMPVEPKEVKDAEHKQKRLDEYMSKLITRANNPDKFYDYMEKMLNFTSEKVLKKVSKIYSLLPSEKEENKIHSKINKRDMNESDYINYEFYKEKNKREMKEKDYSIIKRYLDEYKNNFEDKNPPQK